MPSIYELKPRFQALLRPFVAALARAGITANAVTLFACALSVALGVFLAWRPRPAAFALLPAWLFARMALNAVDGMLAREFGLWLGIASALPDFAGWAMPVLCVLLVLTITNRVSAGLAHTPNERKN